MPVDIFGKKMVTGDSIKSRRTGNGGIFIGSRSRRDDTSGKSSQFEFRPTRNIKLESVYGNQNFSRSRVLLVENILKFKF
jgi:hypothetical protein